MPLYNLAKTEQEHHLVILHRVIVFPTQLVQKRKNTIVLAHLSHQNEDVTFYTSVQLIFRNNIDMDVLTPDGRRFYTGRREEEAFFFDVIGSFSYFQLFDPKTGPTGEIRLSVDVEEVFIREEIPDVSAELLSHVGITPERTIEADDDMEQHYFPTFSGSRARRGTAGTGATTTTTELAEDDLLPEVENDPGLPMQQLGTFVPVLKRTMSKTEIAQFQGKRPKRRTEVAALAIQDESSAGSGVRRRTRSQATTSEGVNVPTTTITAAAATAATTAAVIEPKSVPRTTNPGRITRSQSRQKGKGKQIE